MEGRNCRPAARPSVESLLHAGLPLLARQVWCSLLFRWGPPDSGGQVTHLTVAELEQAPSLVNLWTALDACGVTVVPVARALMAPRLFWSDFHSTDTTAEVQAGQAR